ncbi:hypothetical protein Q428_12900 [Fervidicella metallireducens AeB]|uniref:Uncharacterized protein n=1 Tax=Fervidicella metallireducens AeB TaxID=1403537 RepID=A0A017RST0_9CLOT|nr:hypothetical protein Q428_12900 [Fervidicella metallireducens AeB]
MVASPVRQKPPGLGSMGDYKNVINKQLWTACPQSRMKGTFVIVRDGQ